MAEDPSLTELTQALTQLTTVLAATLERQSQLQTLLERTLQSQRRLSMLQTVLIFLAFVLLFFLAYQVRATHVETAETMRALTKALVEHLPPH